MRKLLVVLLISAFLFSSFAFADTRTIDIETMTIEELEKLIDEVESEKRKATEVSNQTKKKLEADFMKTVEALYPEGTKFSYPFWGLSIIHRRNYYCVCGTVGCKLPDKTKQDLWDATIIYWYDERTSEYHQAAFYTRDKVYFVDDNALQQVENNLEPIARENLRKHNITIKVFEKVTTEPVPTEKVTPTLLPTEIISPTPEVIPTATPSKTGTFSFSSDKTTDIPALDDSRVAEDVSENNTLSNEENDNSHALMFESIAPNASVLNLQAVLQAVPSTLSPFSYDSTYVYYYYLKQALEKGEISESQAATLANYMSTLVRTFEESCFAFKRKTGRSFRDALVISISSGLAFKTHTTSSLNIQNYGIIAVDPDSLIHIDWNDGSGDSYYIGEDSSGMKRLFSSLKTETGYTEVEKKEVNMSYLLGCINYYLANSDH